MSDFEQKSSLSLPEYKAAGAFKLSLRQRCLIVWHFVKTFVVVLLMFVPETLKGLKNLIVPPSPKCIKDKVVLITGAGNGIGRAIAMRIAREKCKLAIVDIDFAAAEQTVRDIKQKFTVEAVPFKVDVSNHLEIAQMKVNVEETLGKVDILINNAGLLCLKMSLREGTDAEIQNAVNVNLTSHFWTLRAFLGEMVKKKEGHVVAICSLAGRFTIPCAVAYCATKFGVHGFMEALKDELDLLDQDFVKTTTVYPTFVNTRKDLEDQLNAAGNLPRIEPKEVADVIVDGVLRNKRKILIPSHAKHLLSLNFLPDKIIRYIKTQSVDTTSYKKYRLSKLPIV